ncbi:MAG: YciI family protein [Ignavibacteriaceae bacterium]|jgi:uncharacterized protein YciI
MKLFFLILFVFSFTLSAQQNDEPKPKTEMMTYYMVFLYRGDKWTPEKTAETEAIQKGHLANITKLHEEGKLILAGPFLDDKELRGIFVMKTNSYEETDSLCNTDPAVKAGRLKVEIKPWYSAKGITIVNKNKESKLSK